ncbi:MAG: GNAT family N-acetyltransferase [Bacteroidetes bacterium]|nr:GNAT family N-acetyltransferase [Bacteroidota bacterium]
MIAFIEHGKIDKRKWDQCIRQSPNGMVYAMSWYLDIVSPGWNALVDGNYQAVFPLTWRKKYNLYYLYQPFFTQQLGVFSMEKNISEKTVSDFLKAIPDQYRLIEIQLNAENNFHDVGFSISEKLTHHLSLDQPYEKISNGYSENLERNIRRANKNKIVLSEQVTPEEIIQLFRKNKGKDVENLGAKEFRVLSHLVRESGNRKSVYLAGARTADGKLCAGTIFLKSNHEYIFLFSAVNEEARKTGAMSLIIDQFIKTHSGEKMNLDFEGSMDKNLARFYQSFGSKEVVYLQIRKNNLPLYIKWLKK